MANDLVDELKKDYPFFELKNKLSIPKSLFLANNEEIIVPEKGTVRIASDKINSFPDFNVFKYLSPDITVLAEYGILERSSPAVPPTPNTPSESE